MDLAKLELWHLTAIATGLLLLGFLFGPEGRVEFGLVMGGALITMATKPSRDAAENTDEKGKAS